jgi:hypothetical protein
MLKWLKKENKKELILKAPTVETNNIYWLLNQELDRCHRLVDYMRQISHTEIASKNMRVALDYVEELHKQLYKLVDKSPDIDTKKELADMQNYIAEQRLLGDSDETR